MINVILAVLFGLVIALVVALILIVEKDLEGEQKYLDDRIDTLSKKIEELKEKINKPTINKIGYK